MTGVVELSWTQAAALAVGLFAGGFAKGGLGFAFPLVVIPIATQFVPLDFTLAVISVLMPFLNLVQFVNGRKMTETLVRFWPMLAGLAVGAPLGALFFSMIDRQVLVLTVGLLIILLVFWTAFRPNIRIPQRAERRFGAVAGIAAGMLGTLTTTNGPVFISYLLGLQLDRETMLSALGLFFFISGLLIAGSFVAIGVLTGPRALTAVACAAPCVLGMWAGNRAARHIAPELFRRLILAMLFLLGVNMTVRAALGL